MKKVFVNILLSVASGILGFLAFPPFGYDYLAWVCLVPLLFVIKKSTPGKAFRYSYLAGVVFFGGLLYWLVNVTVPGTIVLVLVLALFYGLFGYVAGIAFKYSIELLILPFVWVVIEYMRSYALTGFPWGLLGYSQYTRVNLIQLADIMGAYGISFILIVANIAIFSYITRSSRKIAHLVAALGLILLMSVYGAYRLDNFLVCGNPKISVIQGNIPQEFKWDADYAEDVIAEHTGLTREAAKEEPDMIVWPETSYPYLVDAEDQAKEIKELSQGVGIPILSGVVYRSGSDFYNSAFLFSEKGEVAGEYYKLHLVPFGEYIPLEKYLSPIKEYIDKPIGNYTRGMRYTLFPLKSLSVFSSPQGGIVRSVNFFRFGVLICFEDIFPHLAREFVKDGANFLVNMTNDAWFGDTAAAEQHLQASVFRAIENRVPVIRAANTGVSCFIDPTGEVTGRVTGVSIMRDETADTFVKGFKTERIRICAIRSFYTKNGDFFVFFCGFMILLVFVTEMFFKDKDERKVRGTNTP